MPAKSVAETSGAKAQDELWFGSDLSPAGGPADTRARQFRVTFAVQTLGQINMRLNSTLLPFTTALMDFPNTVVIALRDTDTFNLVDSKPGGNTLHYCRVDEIFNEVI